MLKDITRVRRSRIVIGILLAFVAFGFLAIRYTVLADVVLPNAAGTSPANTVAYRGDAKDTSVSDLYTIVFSEPALAGYDGSIPGFPKPGKLRGKEKLDVKSPSALLYLKHLDSVQSDHEAEISETIGRSLSVDLRMKHALNAIVTKLTPEEAAIVAKMPGVSLVERNRYETTLTDVGPTLIGAPPLWDGSEPGVSMAAQGEGKVIAVIDSGINFGSPSFAATDPIDGYVHTNPSGAGNYLGTCAPGGVDAGRCNSKLIGGHDFLCGPPVNACTSNTDEPGFGDNAGHGSHVASTAAGNRRDASSTIGIRRISGVAPRANIIAYDVCNKVTFCPTVSVTGAVNQAVADGIVDVIVYSLSGGVSPWVETASLGLLNAVNAGIFVAPAGGNSGPGLNTISHLEPWTATVGNSQHGRGDPHFPLSVTGPGTVPPNLTSLRTQQSGVTFSAPITDAPLTFSPQYNNENDGCSAYPANTFTGAIAVIRNGTCTLVVKINNAAAAGALAVVFPNPFLGAADVPGTTIPLFVIFESDALNLRSWTTSNPTATASIEFPLVGGTNTVDQIARNSSRGPAGNFDLIKPDMAAPGTAILAVVAGPTITGFEQIVGFKSGTSMAAPHVAGAGLLLKQLRPTWAPSEIKSALAMTAQRTMLRDDGTTPAVPFDMGGGRIRVNVAANAGLVMNETMANYQAANPATGGDPATLNLPSMARRSCAGQCQFTRTFRSTLSQEKTWDASVETLNGTVSPDNFTVPAGGTVTLTITIDTTGIAANSPFKFGRVEIRPETGPADGLLSLPVAVAVPPSGVSVGDATVNEGGPTGQRAFGEDTVDFLVSLSEPSSQTVTVRVSTNGITATEGGDFTAVDNLEVVFPPGTVAQTVSVPLIEDPNDEPEETFSLDITNAINTTIGDGQGVGTIYDDDLPPTAANVTISGRVTGPSGRGIKNARVLLTDTDGYTRTAITGSFGMYTFDDVAPGANYVLAVTARRYSFTPRVVFVTDNLADVDFIGER